MIFETIIMHRLVVSEERISWLCCADSARGKERMGLDAPIPVLFEMTDATMIVEQVQGRYELTLNHSILTWPALQPQPSEPTAIFLPFPVPDPGSLYTLQLRVTSFLSTASHTIIASFLLSLLHTLTHIRRHLTLHDSLQVTQSTPDRGSSILPTSILLSTQLFKDYSTHSRPDHTSNALRLAPPTLLRKIDTALNTLHRSQRRPCARRYDPLPRSCPCRSTLLTCCKLRLHFTFTLDFGSHSAQHLQYLLSSRQPHWSHPPQPDTSPPSRQLLTFAACDKQIPSFWSAFIHLSCWIEWPDTPLPIPSKLIRSRNHLKLVYTSGTINSYCAWCKPLRPLSSPRPLPIAQAAPAYHEENGRLYHGFHKGIYMYPCDEVCSLGHHGLTYTDVVLGRKGAHGYLPSTLSDREEAGTTSRANRVIGRCQDSGSGLRHRHLKPGVGSIEQVEIDYTPRCDDGTLNYDPVVQWYEYLANATAQAARPIAYQHNTRQMLETAGFTDIQEQIIKAPYNPWPKDPHQKEVGRWYCVALTEGLEALSLAAFTRVYRWSAADVKRLLNDVRRCMLTKKCHGYNNM
ncbi:hypothetical protein MRB53_041389 [Persea americana]|nr:hypothetical protein MRB53_041389 [Persea americana]